MKILLAAQSILIERAVNVYLDMRETVEPSQYKDHFANMGEIIAKIEGYSRYGDICNAIEKEEFSILGLAGDDDELEEFIGDVREKIYGKR
jgi:hypothetical protein